ncbi:hypothetical protein D2962_12290 [Biomaibacter acetigenes]|uniref:Uncharacterized protein n=1 Tax=Biomaibacter acetigenes TaxID=2316383 RepID=A0A3G2R791_9FIRM|nr:hypothetical protein D2962_12290 [Biomaibacter acetigenes]RKL61768.1 hypothetical protein DXT63_14930 [Thermoanaerobacteraceae bacterium SP2]
MRSPGLLYYSQLKPQILPLGAENFWKVCLTYIDEKKQKKFHFYTTIDFLIKFKKEIYIMLKISN